MTGVIRPPPSVGWSRRALAVGGVASALVLALAMVWSTRRPPPPPPSPGAGIQTASSPTRGPADAPAATRVEPGAPGPVRSSPAHESPSVDRVLGGLIVAPDTRSKINGLALAARADHIVVAWVPYASPSETNLRVTESLDHGATWSPGVSVDRRVRAHLAARPTDPGPGSNPLIHSPALLVRERDILVAWMAKTTRTGVRDDSGSELRVSRRSLPAGAWTTEVACPEGISSHATPKLADAGDGRVAVLWSGGTNGVGIATWRPGASATARSQLVPPGPGSGHISYLELLRVGPGLLAFAQGVEESRCGLWVSRQAEAGEGPWSRPVRVASVDRRATRAFAAAAGADGTVILVHEAASLLQVRRSLDRGLTFSGPLATLGSAWDTQEKKSLAIASRAMALVRRSGAMRHLDALLDATSESVRGHRQDTLVDVWVSREGIDWAYRPLRSDRDIAFVALGDPVVATSGDDLLLGAWRNGVGLVMVPLARELVRGRR
jgi:hypothetical protein